jgi:beta-galactosidase
VGRHGGTEVARTELRTAAAAAKVLVTADTARVSSDWNDVVRLVETLVDADGTPLPRTSEMVTFTVAGPGTIVAVDNADPASHELFTGTKRVTYNGRCAAWLRATSAGRITVTATAAGLTPGTVTLEAR